ncbi:hypothetical protein J3B02_005933, partial [Coemansia erecta]
SGKKDIIDKHPENIRFQFTRMGYFTLDKDSSMSVADAAKTTKGNDVKLIMNRIVTLKEDPKK